MFKRQGPEVHAYRDDIPTIETMGGLIIGYGEDSLAPSSYIDAPGNVRVEIFDKRIAKSIFAAARNTASEIVMGEPLKFVRGTKPFVYESRVEFQESRWGEVDVGDIERIGLSVEIAGPTERSHQKPHMLPDYQPQIITNIGLLHKNTSTPVESRLDALVDATQMPFDDNSVGSVHISDLPGANFGAVHKSDGVDLRRSAILESHRVIKEDGYLVWDGGVLRDHREITELGFRPVYLYFKAQMIRYRRNRFNHPNFWTSGVYQKTA